MMKIYYTNDIHANYSFLKKVRYYLNQHMTKDDIYLDGGDFSDLKDLIIQCDKAYSAADLYDDIPLAAMAVGNGEIDLSHDALIKLGTKLPLLSCNITDNDGNRLDNIKPSLIIERMNARFLIIGISPFYSHKMEDNGYNVFSMMGNLKINPPEDYIRHELDINRNKYDYCLLLSHSGSNIERYLLDKFKEIDFCLGGHSHEVINEEKLLQTGMGEYLGVITLELKNDSITKTDSELVRLNDVEDICFDKKLNKKKKYADSLLSKELETVSDLTFNPYTESQLTNFICDALLKKFNGDLAIMHAGISESPLLKPVSRKSLIENFPSKLNPAIYKLKGINIIEAVKLSLDKEHIRQSGRGPGFRGTVLGTLGFSHNVRITQNPFLITVNDETIEEEKEYTIVTDDYLQRGTGYPSLAVPDTQVQYHIWFIRDLVQNYLNDSEVFESARIKRTDMSN